MSNMANFFNLFLSFLEHSKYILLFIGCLFEGPVVMISTGFLFSLGKFDFVPMYIALVSGDFVADLGWYLLGRYGTRSTIFKYGSIIKLTPQLLEKVEKRFLEYHQKILIISKLTMGLGFASVVLIVAGIFKVPFKNYAILNLLGGFVWTAFLVVFGYFFGNIYLSLPESTKLLFVGGLFVSVGAILYFLNKYLRSKNI